MKTLNILLAAASLFCASALLPAQAAAASAAGITVFVDGDVQLLRKGAAAYEPLGLNVLLQSGDTVKTGPGARASIVTKKGAEIRINSDTELTMPSGGLFARYYFKLASGQLWSRMLHKAAKLNVRTPVAICAVRGTEADIEQRSMLTVKVYEGHVDVRNDKGLQSLYAGQMSTVTGAAAAPSAPRKMSEADYGSWQDGARGRDLGKYLERMGLSGKDLRIKINRDGQETDVNVRLKEKQGAK